MFRYIIRHCIRTTCSIFSAIMILLTALTHRWTTTRFTSLCQSHFIYSEALRQRSIGQSSETRKMPGHKGEGREVITSCVWGIYTLHRAFEMEQSHWQLLLRAQFYIIHQIWTRSSGHSLVTTCTCILEINLKTCLRHSVYMYCLPRHSPPVQFSIAKMKAFLFCT